MLVSLKHRLVILAMPKCASTSLELALAGRMDIVISGNPAAKHTPYRKYDRFLRRYFESFTNGPLDVICLFREPLDWLRSWWRYRGRDDVPDGQVSARGWSFEDFVRAYAGDRRGPAAVGGQARFVSDRDGGLGVDRIFRYDEFEHFIDYLEGRLATRIELDRLNVSPLPQGASGISDAGRAIADRAMGREYEIYRMIAK